MNEPTAGAKKMQTVLYNAISLLVDETFEQYDDTQEWFDMVLNELDVSAAELEQMGVTLTVDGGVKSTAVPDLLTTEKSTSPLMAFIEEEVPFRMRELNDVEISDEECADLVDALQNNTDVMFDYDAIDEFLMDKLYELRQIDLHKVRTLQSAISALQDELEGAEIYDPDKATDIEKVLLDKINELEEALNPHKETLSENVTLFPVDMERCNEIVDSALQTTDGTGILNGSGYFVVNSFELYQEQFNLIVELFKVADEQKPYYGVHYAVAFDGGDHLFSDYDYTVGDSVDELKQLVFEIANTDFSQAIQRSFMVSQLGLSDGAASALNDLRMTTLSDITNIGRDGLKRVLGASENYMDVLRVLEHLGVHLPEGYAHTSSIVRSINPNRLSPQSYVTVAYDERPFVALAELVYANSTADTCESDKDRVVCVDVVYNTDPNTKLCDVQEVFCELDMWPTSSINAVSVAEAIAGEYGIPLVNLVPEQKSIDAVLNDAIGRSADESVSHKDDLIKE